jgi:hypothetical protein
MHNTVLPRSTTMVETIMPVWGNDYDGCVLINMLGHIYLYMPYFKRIFTFCAVIVFTYIRP